MKQKTIRVSAIKNGTVIDHIPANKGIQIVSHLKLAEDRISMLGINFESKKEDRKDVLKIEDRELTPEELNQLAIYAPEATVNIIRNFEKVDKFQIKLPEIFENIIKCPNPKCITNHEEVKTRFKSLNGNPLSVKCMHCEKIFKEEEISLKKWQT